RASAAKPPATNGATRRARTVAVDRAVHNATPQARRGSGRGCDDRWEGGRSRMGLARRHRANVANRGELRFGRSRSPLTRARLAIVSTAPALLRVGSTLGNPLP